MDPDPRAFMMLVLLSKNLRDVLPLLVWRMEICSLVWSTHLLWGTT